MEVLAHTLWAAAGVALLQRRTQLAPRTVELTLGLAALPDAVPLLPIAGWWVAGSGSFDALHELQRRRHQVRGAAAPRCSELQLHMPGSVELQTFVGEPAG